MKQFLHAIAQIRFGYYAPLTADSGIPYLQSKQFDDAGNLIALPETFLAADNKNTTHLLKDGDILLAGKGSKNFAWCYHAEFGPAVASTIFFVITPDPKLVLPEYLVALFHHSTGQQYFRQFGLGSNIQSIRKNELGDFVVPVLSFDLQEKIVALNKLHKHDINLTLQLLQKKNDLYDSVINNLINN